MTDQPSTLFTDLRASTCKMLGLDPANLSALESLRTDMVCSLRLECDRIMAQQLRGEPCDLRALTMATEALQNMLRPAFTAVADHDRDDAAATAELERLIDGELASREFEADAKMQREELAAVAAAMPVSDAPETLSTVDNVPSPSNNVRHDYIDHACIPADPDKPPVPTVVTPADQARYCSLNNPGSQPTPRAPHTVSGTYSAFADYAARRGGGIKRWEPPAGF